MLVPIVQVPGHYLSFRFVCVLCLLFIARFFLVVAAPLFGVIMPLQHVVIPCRVLVLHTGCCRLHQVYYYYCFSCVTSTANS